MARTPRLSDEEPDHFEAPADRAGYDPGRDHDPDHDANAYRHLDDSAGHRTENAGDGLSEDLALYGDGVIPDDDHHLSADMIDEMHGGETSDGLTATGRMTDEAALHGARPIRGEEDTRPVWINDGEPIDWDNVPPHVQAAFDEAIAAFNAYLDAFYPQDTQMGDLREGITWNHIHGIHHQHDTKERLIKQITTRIETLERTKPQRIRELGNDGADRELDLETTNLITASEERLILAMQRDHLARFYFEENHKVWAPRSGTHISTHPEIGSTIDGRDFQKARKKAVALPAIPEGTVVVVTAAKTGPAPERIIETLNAYHKKHPDMILLHGNAPGTQQIAAKWAARRQFGGREIALEPDFNAHPGDTLAAVKKRDAQMLMANPDYVLSFTGPAEKLPFIHRQAIERGIAHEHITDERHSRLVSPPRHERTYSPKTEQTPGGGIAEQSEPYASAAPPNDATPDQDAHDRLAASFAALDKDHGLTIDNFRQGTADVYDQDRKIGLIQHINNPDTGMAAGTHILTLYQPTLSSHEFSPDQDPATETVAIRAGKSLSDITRQPHRPENNIIQSVEDPDIPQETKDANQALRTAFDGLDPSHALSLRDIHDAGGALYKGDQKIGFVDCILEPQPGMPLHAHVLHLHGPSPSDHVVPPGQDPAIQTVAVLNRLANLERIADADRRTETAAAPTYPSQSADTTYTCENAPLGPSLEPFFQALHDTSEYTYDLNLRDVTDEGTTADLYHEDRQIGTIQTGYGTEDNWCPNTTLVHLFGPVPIDHVIPPGKDPAAETVALFHRLEQAASFPEPHHATPEPTPEHTTAFDAFDAVIDRFLPSDAALPEHALHYDGQDPHPLRTLLKANLVEAVHATISGPNGAHEQLSSHTDETAELARANIDSDIDVTQRHQNEEHVHYTTGALAGLEELRETVENNYEHETGERWSPKPAHDPIHPRPVTAASAEARRHIEKLENDHYQSRLPPGDPIAVTAYNSEADRETVFAKLDQVFAKHPGKWIAHGAQNGTPLTHVTEWARHNGVEQVHFQPDWKNHPKNAVAHRDLEIAKLNPIGVIEFNDGPKPTKLAQEMARKNPNLVHTVQSPKAIAAKQTRDPSQERTATDQHSRDRGQDMAAGISV
ncbi:MAG: SLOG family protein [Defluviicoccus sp.]|nr:SLOG family protein [Defluviicoccus sp.]MDE0334481.1 SLOG family protein [Defluviicoccus sp.]